MPPRWDRSNVVPLAPLWRVRSRATGRESTSPVTLDQAAETCRILNGYFGPGTFHPFPHRDKGKGPGDGPGPLARAG